MGSAAFHNGDGADPVKLRILEERDRERVKELECGFDWQFGRDFLCGVAVVDDADRPVMVAAAWKRAEVHMVLDQRWASPREREEAFAALHAGMAAVLANDGVAEAITWMDGMKAFGRRLKRLGWDTAKRTMWARRLF